MIQERAIMGSFANIRATTPEIIIGRNALIAQTVALIVSGHAISGGKPYRDLPWDESKTGVIIEENVWIGAGVTVLRGCVIGEKSVIKVGSVVTKSVPRSEVGAGIPTHKLTSITDINEAKLKVNSLPESE